MKFSVIIPTLNEEKFLPNLLESLVQQSKKNFEVIVVDGSSSDRTVEKAESYQKRLPKLTVLVSGKASLPLQRNLGAKQATGEWLVFVDADSVLMPYFVERISRFIDSNSPQLFTTWFSSDSENPKDSVFTLFANLYIESTIIIKRQTPPGPMAIVRKNIFQDIGGYDEEHAFNEDLDFGLRAYKHGIQMSILRESLYIWSLRRYRKQGTLKVLNQYFVSMFPVIFLNKTLKNMPGYTMGGQLYSKTKTPKQSALKKYEERIKALLNELFE